MRLKLMTVLAAATFALAACSSDDEMGTTTTTSTSTTSYSSLQEALRSQVGDRVFFDFDRYDLRSDAQQTVQALAAWLNANAAVSLVVEGHADERGTREYNLALGERRANSVLQYLVSLGINPSRLSTVSYGEERPAALGSDEAAWAQNRRAVFAVQ